MSRSHSLPKYGGSEGGLALPLPYTIYEQPSYSIVSSNALWSDPERAEEAKALKQDEIDTAPKKTFLSPGYEGRSSYRGILPWTFALQL